MENKKYELVVDKTIDWKGVTLRRIRALKDFSDVKKGDLGGYVEWGEYNLDQEGECWIYDNAKVYNYAQVCGNAKIYDNVEIYGYVARKQDFVMMLFGSPIIRDNVTIKDSVKVAGFTTIGGNENLKGTLFIENGEIKQNNEKEIKTMSNEKKNVVMVNLTSTHLVKPFVEACEGFEETITVGSTNYVVNAKSILGMLSVVSLQPVEVKIETTNEQTFIDFVKAMQPFLAR